MIRTRKRKFTDISGVLPSCVNTTRKRKRSLQQEDSIIKRQCTSGQSNVNIDVDIETCKAIILAITHMISDLRKRSRNTVAEEFKNAIHDKLISTSGPPSYIS